MKILYLPKFARQFRKLPIEIKQAAKKSGSTYKKKVSELEKTLTLKRFIKPTEVANLVNFLMSEEGSGVTGQIYEIK